MGSRTPDPSAPSWAAADSPELAEASTPVGRRGRSARQPDRLVIAEVEERLARARDPATLLAEVVRAPVAALGAAGAALLVYDTAGSRLVVRESVDLPAPLRGRALAADALPILPPRRRGQERRGAGRPRPLTPADLPGLAPWQPALALPLMRGETSVGLLLLGPRSDGAPYTPAALVLLDALAAGLTGAVERADLIARYTRRQSELQTLNRLGQALGARLSIGTVCHLVYDHLRAALDFDSIFIGYWDEAQDVMLYPLAMDEGQIYAITPSDGATGLVGWIFQHRQPLIIPDLVTRQSDYKPDPFGSTRRSRAWLGVPLLTEGRIVGVLSVQSYTANLYTAEHAQFLSTVASQAAGALENARLAGERERRISELSVLNEISRQISANLRIDDLLRTIHREVGRIVDATSFYIALYNPGEEMLEFRYQVEAGSVVPVKTRPMDNGLTEWIIRHRQPLFVSHDLQAAKPGLGIASATFGSEARSWLGVPLLVADQVIGVMAVQSYDRDYAFDAAHRDLFITIAAQAAVVLENARLYEQTDTALTRRVAQLSSIEEIARQINASRDLEEIIELVVQRAVATVGARAGVLALYDEDAAVLRILGQVGYPPDIAAQYRASPLPINEGLIGRAVRRGYAQLVADVRHDPDYIAVLPDVEAQLSVPVRGEGRILGVLSLESTTADRFTADTVEFVAHLAEHAALAIENAASYEREREQNRALTRRAGELAAILQVGNSLRADLPLEAILQAVVDGVTAHLGFNKAVLSLFEEAEGTSYVVRAATAGLTEADRPQTRRKRAEVERLLQPQWAVGGGYMIPYDQNPLYDFRARRMADPSIPPSVAPDQWHPLNMCVVPVSGKGGGLLGFLAVDGPADGRVPSAPRIEPLEILASVAALAIENAASYRREYEQNRALLRRSAQLGAILQVGNSLRADLPLAAVLQQVTEGVTSSLGFGVAILSMTDDDNPDEVVRVASTGLPPAEWERLRGGRRPLAALETLMEPQFRLGPAYFIPHIDQVPPYQGVAYYRPNLPENVGPGEWHPDDQFAIPLRGKGGRLLGFLAIDEPLDGRVPDRETAETLAIFANVAATAVEDAARYEHERAQAAALARRARELAAILQVANSLSADLPLEAVLQGVVAGLADSLGFRATILSLLVEDDPPYYQRVASVGVPPDRWEVLKAIRRSVVDVERYLQPQFAISQSFFIPHTADMLADLTYYRPDMPEEVVPGQWHPDDLMAVPLRGRGGRRLGFLSVDEPTDGLIPDRAAIETLEIFASVAALAIESARLFSERGQRLTELATLQELGLSLTTMLDLDAVLGQIARATLPLLQVQASVLLLFDGSRAPRYRAMRGSWVDGVPEAFPLDAPSRPGGLTDTVRTSATPVVIADISRDPRINPAVNQWGMRSLIGVPLRLGADTLGVLYAYADTVRLFADHEVDLLQIFGNQVAVAIANARLFQERDQRLTDLATLQSVGVGLTATLDLDAVLAEIARAILPLLHVQSSSVMLAPDDPDQPYAVVRGSWQDEVAVAEPMQRPVRLRGLTYTVRSSIAAVVIPDTAVDDRVSPLLLRLGVQALIGVPLRLGAEVLGVLYAYSDTPRAFADHEVDLLEIFANQAAVAIANARLFAERRAAEERLETENTRMTRELVTARATQQRLLPQMPLTIAGLMCHGVCLPAMEVGGDYFDVLPLPDGRVALALGDVTGKGTAAVMLTAMVKSALLAQVARDPAPAAVFAALYTLSREFLQERLMTFFYALWNPGERMLQYFNAGHLFPYVRHPNGVLVQLEQGGLPLGSPLSFEQDLGWMPLDPGDTFVCISDGIVEANNATGELYGFGRLETLLKNAPNGDPSALVPLLVDDVWHFAAGPPNDDVTVLIVQVE